MKRIPLFLIVIMLVGMAFVWPNEQSQMVQAEEPLDTTAVQNANLAVPTFIEGSRVEIYQNYVPWFFNEAKNEAALEELGLGAGVDYGVRPMTALQTGISPDAEMIIIASASLGNQLNQIADQVHPAAQANLDAFVKSGGVLVAHLGDNDSGFPTAYQVPGLLGTADDALNCSGLSIVDPNHPFIIGPDGVAGSADDLTNDNIDARNQPFCFDNHGSLAGILPANAHIVLREEGGLQHPVWAEYQLGQGHVIVTTLTLEFFAHQFQTLINELAYANSVASNPEAQLVEKFRPTLYFTADEQYRPQEIQVALDTGDIINTNTDAVELRSPLSPDDLASRTEDHYKLDLDGDVFIANSPVTGDPYKNTIYAHITKDQDSDGNNHIVLQYWFFYYFNDWQGAITRPIADFQHEGDWEFIQLIFPANVTLHEIIEQDIPPNQAVYSAHLGGYRQSWNSVEKENDRPVVYVAQGSHANHFQKGVCDVTPPRAAGVDVARPDVVLTDIRPSQPIVDPIVKNTEFEWLLFDGIWGENFINSPPGPLHQEVPFSGESKWFTPIDWPNADVGGFSLVLEWNTFYFDHCDGDFDGIWNNADPEPNVFSDDFSAPDFFGNPTTGTIVERGDRELKIKDAQVGGVSIDIGIGSETAIIQTECFPRSTIIAPPGQTLFGIATCASSELSVEEGSADFTTSHNGMEAVATVGANQTVKYDIIDDKLHVETSGEGEISLLVNGKPTTIQAGETFFVQEIQIDIKPGSDPNAINCKNRGRDVIPVAILTTDEFDAATVDHTSVVFEGASEAHKNRRTGEPQRHEEDVGNDGDTDLVFHFQQNETALTCESAEGTLIGRTFEGDIVIGTDSIKSKGGKAE